MDEDYWRRYRRRALQRAAAQGLLIIAPIGIALALLWIAGPMDHPAGDIRDQAWFRLLRSGAVIAFELALIVGSVRVLRRGPSDDGV